MIPLARILDLARWAPSGDNTQPWRFSIEEPDRVVVFGHDTRDHCVYDLDGRASQIAIGALLESIAIAATRFETSAEIARRPASPDNRPVFDVSFRYDPGTHEDPLAACLERRCVQRRPMRTTALSVDQKLRLEKAVGSAFGLRWFEGPRQRSRVAWLNFKSSYIRLTIPEAFELHRSIIAWNSSTSEDRIPSQALGASAPTLRLMRWAMASWARFEMLNHVFAGSLAPRVELDLIPGLACAGHCLLIAKSVPLVLEDYLAVGAALQRFWLTATHLGLQFQPEYTPLVFARYAREGRRFSESNHAMAAALSI